ncbi:MAG TPA: glycosidase, partial [Chloroflexota bacterium]
MADLAERFGTNPLLTPSEVPASRTDLRVTCVLNPGAFTYGGKTWLVLRVAEGIPTKEGIASA